MQQGNNDSSVETEASASGDNAQLVELCAAQLQAALDEARQEIDALSQAIVSAATQVNSLTNEISCESGVTVTGLDAGAISTRSNAATDAVNTLFLRLQFTDRLNQRVSNVQHNLVQLATYMRSRKPLARQPWFELLEQARATFTMEHEREMFDAVFGAARGLANAPFPKPTESAQSNTHVLFDQERKDA